MAEHGHIHFVTPTNRWMGSIPLSTLDPLTLEPLWTYVRSEDQDDHSDRTTNMTGQPVSLILARLQTTPEGCSCGCTVPAPPKHSDYYHAQHLLRLLFQTQRVRSHTVQTHLPQYFAVHEDEEDRGLPSSAPTRTLHNQHSTSSTVIPMDQPPRQHTPSSSRQRRKRQRRQKIPRWIHYLVQNRAIRNPLTNTEIEGDPTFYLVLEPGRGGWWYEPWAMAPRTESGNIARVQTGSTGQRHHHLHHHHHHHQSHSVPQPDSSTASGTEEQIPTPQTIQEEKEARKERWRQSRIANLELEAQHELDWRRWRRSLLDNEVRPGESRRHDKKTRTRNMRFKLGKDIAILEPSERGLWKPRKLKRASAGKETNRDPLSSSCGPSSESSVQATSALDEVELKDIRAHEQQQQQAHPAPRQEHLKTSSSYSSSKAQTPSPSVPWRSTQATMPWWEPDPQPFTMPNTMLSPFAISTLPEPVSRHFGGASIYSTVQTADSDPSLEQGVTTAPEVQPLKDSAPSDTSSTEKSQASESEHASRPDGPTSTGDDANTAGCQWVPVSKDDRVAVMIGTSQDFLFFPSLQRLFFRHQSREDFEDGVGRVGVISCPVTTVVREGRHAEDGGRRRGRGHHGWSGSDSEDDSDLARRDSRESPSSEDGQLGQSENGVASTAETPQGQELWSWRSIFRRQRPATVPNIGTHADTMPTTASPLNEPSSTMINGPIHGNTPVPETGAASLTASPGSATQEKLLPDQDPQETEPVPDEESFKEVWMQNKEIFEREDYDSSDYSYSVSPSEDDDDSLWYDDSGSSSSGTEEQSEGEFPSMTTTRTRIQRNRTRAETQRGCWTLQDWVHLLLFCKRRSREQSAQATRRARQRQQRQEQLRNLQRQQQQMHGHSGSPIWQRWIPSSVRGLIGPAETRRCCQIMDFCRFYLTIMMAITLMGAIVYGAVHAEGGSSKREGHSPPEISLGHPQKSPVLPDQGIRGGIRVGMEGKPSSLAGPWNDGVLLPLGMPLSAIEAQVARQGRHHHHRVSQKPLEVPDSEGMEPPLFNLPSSALPVLPPPPPANAPKMLLRSVQGGRQPKAKNTSPLPRNKRSK